LQYKARLKTPMRFKERIGLIKSWLMYYGKPSGSINLKRFYAGFIRPGMLCFDIGAHLGNRTTTWLKLGAEVVAVEPQPVCIAFLEKKFSNNPRVNIVKKGLGQIQGVSTMRISSLNPAVSTLSPQDWMYRMKNAASFNLEWDNSIEVEITTLDALINEFGIPGFCKIDTEGYELHVLSGLSQPLPLLCFEVISIHKEAVAPCLQKLASLGNYEFNWSVGESLTFELNNWTNEKKILAAINAYPKKIFAGDIYARHK
jgi:FkbM family methyltransferase